MTGQDDDTQPPIDPAAKSPAPKRSRAKRTKTPPAQQSGIADDTAMTLAEPDRPVAPDDLASPSQPDELLPDVTSDGLIATGAADQTPQDPDLQNPWQSTGPDQPYLDGTAEALVTPEAAQPEPLGDPVPQPEPIPEPEPMPEAEAAAAPVTGQDSDAGSREPVPVAPQARRGTPVLALLLGGALAAGIGFVAARYVIPEGWPITLSSERINALDRKVVAQEKQIADLRAASTATDPRLDAALADIAAARTAATEAIAALETRVAALEQRPSGGADTGPLTAEIDALKFALTALQTEMTTRPAVDISDQIAALTAAAAAEREALEARAAALQEETRAAATAATARGVLLRLQAALDTGGAIGPLLEELTAAGVTVPQPLAVAADGVLTLTQLQASFPEAARAALAAAVKVTPDAGLGDRLATFLRVQTGARSLTPRDGDDPDAVLSRAEAALRGGDLTGALVALDGLSTDAQAAMAAWRDSATARSAAVAAADELAAGLSGN